VSLPVLVASDPREPLYLYIAAAAEVVSMVLVVERVAQEGQEPEGQTSYRGPDRAEAGLLCQRGPP
jgi:hypothetical protein